MLERDAQTDFARLLLPRGERADAWSERIVVSRLERGEAESPGQILDRLLEAHRGQCPDLIEHRMPIDEALAAGIGIAIWTCPHYPQSGRGGVRTLKVLVGPRGAYLMSAEGDYPRFEPGTTPLLRAQLERWSTLHRSFGMCDDFTVTGCLPDPEKLALGKPKALDPAQAAAVQQIVQLAVDLYRVDQIAWMGTDYAILNRVIKTSGRGRYLVVPDAAGGGMLYFVRDRLGGRSKARWVKMDGRGEFSHSRTYIDLPPEVAVRDTALRTALASKDIRICSATANTAVLPDPEGDGWIVYVLSASGNADVVPIGGHNRIRVSADGREVRSIEYSANSCFAFDRTVRGPDGEAPAYYSVTHLVSPMPWETHLLQSMTFGLNLIVVTQRAAWRVLGDEMWPIDVD